MRGARVEIRARYWASARRLPFVVGMKPPEPACSSISSRVAQRSAPPWAAIAPASRSSVTEVLGLGRRAAAVAGLRWLAGLRRSVLGARRALELVERVHDPPLDHVEVGQ